MKTRLIILSCLILNGAISAQKFPELSGKNLAGENRILPDDYLGKYTIVGLSYSQKAEGELRTWFDPVFDKFVLKLGMFDDTYDVNVLFVPMFHGASKVTFEKAFKSVKQKTDDDFYPYVLFYKGEIKTYKTALDMPEKEWAYCFFLDPSGTIIKAFKGPFREKYMEEIEDILNQ